MMAALTTPTDVRNSGVERKRAEEPESRGHAATCTQTQHTRTRRRPLAQGPGGTQGSKTVCVPVTRSTVIRTEETAHNNLGIRRFRCRLINMPLCDAKTVGARGFEGQRRCGRSRTASEIIIMRRSKHAFKYYISLFTGIACDYSCDTISHRTLRTQSRSILTCDRRSAFVMVLALTAVSWLRSLFLCFVKLCTCF